MVLRTVYNDYVMFKNTIIIIYAFLSAIQMAYRQKETANDDSFKNCFYLVELNGNTFICCLNTPGLRGNITDPHYLISWAIINKNNNVKYQMHFFVLIFLLNWKSGSLTVIRHFKYIFIYLVVSLRHLHSSLSFTQYSRSKWKPCECLYRL